MEAVWWWWQLYSACCEMLRVWSLCSAVKKARVSCFGFGRVGRFRVREGAEVGYRV